MWIALTIFSIIPIWTQRLLPFQDSPNHMALARAWHDYHHPEWHIADFYDLRIRVVPYFLYYVVMHLLMYVMPIETANKLFVTAYVIFFPLAVLAFARAIKRPPWLALGGFVLTFNICYAYGFSSYVMGTCFMFLSWALLLRFLETGERRLGWLLCLSTTACYLGHVLAWGCFGLGCAPILLIDRHRWKRGLIAIAAFAPSLVLAFAAWLDERDAHTYVKAPGAFQATWYDGPTLAKRFVDWTTAISPDGFGGKVLWVVVATVIVLAIWKGTRLQNRFGAREDRVLHWLIYILLALYLLLPHQIKQPMSWWFIAERMPGMMAPLLLLLPAGTIRGRERLLLIPIIVASIAFPLHLVGLYRRYDRKYQPFIRLVDTIPVGKTCFVVSRPQSWFLEPQEESTVVTVDEHFTSWPMALKGGYSAYLFDQGIPVRPRVKLEAPIYRSPTAFSMNQAPAFDYYLVQNPLNDMQHVPTLERVGELGSWVLFKHRRDLTDEP